MTTKNFANIPKLVLKDLCEKSFVQNVLYSTLVKCKSMIISIVTPSYPNVSLILCYISEH